jgi:hypothetical protein
VSYEEQLVSAAGWVIISGDFNRICILGEANVIIKCCTYGITKVGEM